MKLIGINYSKNANGMRAYTLHITDEFNSYYSDAEAGRGSIGLKVESVYVGDYDCSGIKVGSEIDISYNKAITTTKGTFQTIKHIDVLTDGK